MRDLSNEVLYDILSQGASELPEVQVKNSQKICLSSKVESLNLQFVAVLMPLEIKRHKVPHLKALTRSIQGRIGHGYGSTFGSATVL